MVDAQITFIKKGLKEQKYCTLHADNRRRLMSLNNRKKNNKNLHIFKLKFKFLMEWRKKGKRATRPHPIHLYAILCSSFPFQLESAIERHYYYKYELVYVAQQLASGKFNASSNNECLVFFNFLC